MHQKHGVSECSYFVVLMSDVIMCEGITGSSPPSLLFTVVHGQPGDQAIWHCISYPMSMFSRMFMAVVLSNQIMAMHSMLDPLPLPSNCPPEVVYISLCCKHVVMSRHSEGCIVGHLLPQVLYCINAGSPTACLNCRKQQTVPGKWIPSMHYVVLVAVSGH